MSTWSDIATFSTAGLSALAALGSLRAARQANDVSANVAKIESERWRVEQTPHLSVHFERFLRLARLHVFLEGPQHLQVLESLTVEVLDDDHDRSITRPGGPTLEEIAAQIWGPYQFVPGVDGADSTGRSITISNLNVGSGRPFAMQRTQPPHWQTSSSAGANWYPHHPIRIRMTCRGNGEEWVIVKSISTQPPQDDDADLYEEPDV